MRLKIKKFIRQTTVMIINPLIDIIIDYNNYSTKIQISQ